MNKIKSISFYAARLFSSMIIIMPVCIILKWGCMDTPFLQYCLSLRFDWLPSHAISDMIHFYEITTWTPLTRLLACLSELCWIAPWLGILYFLAKIFYNYEIGEIFTKINAQFYYYIGQLLFFDALLTQPMSGGLQIAAATFSNPVGHRYISISLGMPNVMAVLIGLLVIFISWVMIEGSKIQDEQQLII